MSRIKKDTGERLNIYLNEPVRQIIEKLRLETNAASVSEVIRRAIVVYNFVHQEEQKGGKFVVKNKDGGESNVIFI